MDLVNVTQNKIDEAKRDAYAAQVRRDQDTARFLRSLEVKIPPILPDPPIYLPEPPPLATQPVDLPDFRQRLVNRLFLIAVSVGVSTILAFYLYPPVHAFIGHVTGWGYFAMAAGAGVAVGWCALLAMLAVWQAIEAFCRYWPAVVAAAAAIIAFHFYLNTPR